jgi:hypothetical protein
MNITNDLYSDEEIHQIMEFHNSYRSSYDPEYITIHKELVMQLVGIVFSKIITTRGLIKEFDSLPYDDDKAELIEALEDIIGIGGSLGISGF